MEQFDHDPRIPRSAPLRASDRDRAVIETVLAEAFAEGRLDRAEYDARSTAATGAKVLADLVPHVEDLVPDAPYASWSPAPPATWPAGPPRAGGAHVGRPTAARP